MKQTKQQTQKANSTTAPLKEDRAAIMIQKIIDLKRKLMIQTKQRTQRAELVAAMEQNIHGELKNFAACIYPLIDDEIIAEFPIEVFFKNNNLTIRLMVKPPSDSSLTLNA